MEQRHITGKSHWYHETQSSTAEYDVLPLVPEAAKVSDPFLLDVILDEETLAPFLSWLVPARVLAVELFPDQLTVTRSQTFTAYERLSTALTVAQVCGVQRLCNYYSARLTPLPGPDSSRESNHRLAQITQYARQLASSPSIIDNRSRQHLNDVGLTVWDCVIINQIIGFIGFQARTIATFQAYLGIRYAGYPGWRYKTTPTRHSLLMNHYAGEAAMRWKNYLKSTQKVQLQNFANWPKYSLSTLFHFPFSKSC